MVVALAALALVGFAGGPAHVAEAASCKTLSYGCVGYTRSGTENFVRRQLNKKISAWKAGNGRSNARVGATDIACKKFLQIGFFVEWECNAKAKVCG